MSDFRDPSAATLAAIQAANEATSALIGARLDGLEKAAALFREDIIRVPTLLDRASEISKEFQQERFSHMRLMTDAHYNSNRELISSLAASMTTHGKMDAERFAATENRAQERAAANKSALDAAFAANALANQKMETSFTKTVDSLNERVSDLKDRIIASESKNAGAETANRDNTAWIFAVIAIVVSIGGVLIDVVWLRAAGAVH